MLEQRPNQSAEGVRTWWEISEPEAPQGRSQLCLSKIGPAIQGYLAHKKQPPPRTQQ